jgi:hypothetical protein
MSDDPMAYIARKPCGCFVFASDDTPARQHENAKEIAWCVKHGYVVEHVTGAYVRLHWRSACPACVKPAPVKQEAMLI